MRYLFRRKAVLHCLIALVTVGFTVANVYGRSSINHAGTTNEKFQCDKACKGPPTEEKNHCENGVCSTKEQWLAV